ncbi:hypothetical protein [Rubrivirga sp.]|uniref:hypothetical protein n=1 Tax=Rubrivirga sp. TaxID=1885344 RepID=UPI003B522B5B
MAFRSLLLLLVLGLIACDSTDADTYAADAQSGEVSIALDETASLDGLSLTFDDVVEDSRCPAGVACIWEGQARVSLMAGGQEITLLVVDPERRPDAGARVGDRVLFAVRLTPEPTQTPSDDTPVVTVVSFDR